MDEMSTWPPPPDLPKPLEVHDEFLVTSIRASQPKLPLSRLRLVRDLHLATGLSLRQCLAVVNDFCDRHAILLPVRGFGIWAMLLCHLVSLTALLAMNIAWYILRRSHDAATTRAERIAISTERLHLDYVFLGVILISTCVSLIFILRRNKDVERDAEAARAKLA